MMKKIFKKITLGILLVLISNITIGQRNILRYSDVEFDLKRFEHAGAQYAEAYKQKQTYYAAKRAAKSYTFIKSYKNAFEWWKRVVTFEESDRSDYLSYARSAIQADRSLAELNIILVDEEYLHVFGQKEVSENRGIEFLPLEVYNGDGTDYGLRVDLDGKRYVISDKNISNLTKKSPIRFDIRKRFSSTDRYRMNDRGFHNIFTDQQGVLNEVVVELDGVYHLSTPTFFSNGEKQEVIFTAVVKDERRRRKSRNHEVYPGLYRAEVQADGSFGSVSALPINQSSSYSMMHSFVQHDRLYFSSDMPGGFGGFDLYYVEMIGEGYGPAVNMGPKVNGLGDEVFPYAYQGDLYFSSNRTEGLGGLDIYKIDEQLSGKVSNMGKPYNTGQDDFAYYIDSQGVQYLSSDRGMSESRDDIYSLRFLRDLYKLRVFAENGDRLDEMEDLELKVTRSDGSAVALEKLDGRVAGLEEGEYMIEISRKGYFPAKVPLSTLALDGKEKVIDYTLVPIPYGKLLTIDTIYYDLDKSNIRPDASEILDRAASILGAYPEFNLDITSHTDSRASNAYNEKLSEKRSRSAASYLGGLDIADERIHIDWMGEKDLVNPCIDGVHCPEDMHEMNRRSVLSLTIYPEEGSEYKLPAGLEYVQSTEELLEAIKSMIGEKRNQLGSGVLVEKNVRKNIVDFILDPDAILQIAKGELNKNPMLKLDIAPYIDSRQSSIYDQSLSKNRVKAVGTYVKNKKLSSERMISNWFTKTNLSSMRKRLGFYS